MEIAEILENPVEGVYLDINKFIPNPESCLYKTTKIFTKFLRKGSDATTFLCWFENSSTILCLKVFDPLNSFYNSTTSRGKSQLEYQNLTKLNTKMLPAPHAVGVIKFGNSKSHSIGTIKGIHEFIYETIICNHCQFKQVLVDTIDDFEYYAVVKQFIPGKPLNEILSTVGSSYRYHYKSIMKKLIESLTQNGFYIHDIYPGNFIVSANNFPFNGSMYLIDCLSLIEI